MRENGTTVAAHAEHLRWSLALANAYARGEKPQPKWSESWSVQTVDVAAWNALRTALRREYETLYDAVQNLADFSDEMLLKGLLALAPHAAYHLGAIRQVVPLVKRA